jgi:hypothetical protein
LGPLTWNIPFKKLPNFGMYYEIIPRNFVKIYGFKNITRTNEIISRNLVKIYGFKNITGTTAIFCRTSVILIFSEIINTEIQWKFQIWIASVSQTQSLNLLCSQRNTKILHPRITNQLRWNLIIFHCSIGRKKENLQFFSTYSIRFSYTFSGLTLNPHSKRLWLNKKYYIGTLFPTINLVYIFWKFLTYICMPQTFKMINSCF